MGMNYLCFLMTRTIKLSIFEYWSRDSLICKPVFSNYMSQNRFLYYFTKVFTLLPQFPLAAGDGLFNLPIVLDELQNNFKSSFRPLQNVCTDEILLLFKIYCIKHYIQLKRNWFDL